MPCGTQIATLLAALPIVVIGGLLAYVIFSHYRDKRRFGQRLRERRCANCDYDLRGNLSGVCPECGREIGDGRLTFL